MKRIITKKLIHWKDAHRRKPLLVRGGRQVGKTWSIEHFGRDYFDNCVKLDFERRRDLHALFDGELSPHKIVSQLELIFSTPIKPGGTLLFFDEIQACPRALMSLRYFYEDLPSLHVIGTGSLLEFALKNISFPVGRIQYANMFPLCFYEFLFATGNSRLALELHQPVKKFPDIIHKTLMNELKNFFFVGGMPECVKVYAETNSILESFQVQDEIIEAHKQDFGKYAPRADKTCLNMIMQNAAQQIGNQTKYSKLAGGYANPTIHNNFDLLSHAKLINKIPSSDPSGLPLGAGVNSKKFKTSLLDIGLTQRLSRLSVENEINHSDLLAIYKGRLAEQYVAQELLIAQNSELYYWARPARGSTAEVDFLIQREDKINPVEVKSGKGGSLKSLHLMLETYPGCGRGIVLYGGGFGKLSDKKIDFWPLYYAFQLTNTKETFANYMLE